MIMTLTARCRQRLRAAVLPFLALTLALFSAQAAAEGSRTVYPDGATGNRAALSDSYNNLQYANVAENKQFLYVFAQAGEQILLGSSNRNNGGDIFVYKPQPFGTRGMETIPANADFSCSSQSGAGHIANRDQELAGPNSADGSATVTNGFTPCVYQAPETGIYGVRFTGATSGTTGNSGAINNVQVLSRQVSAWDVTVRESAGSLEDINGRLFTYAWVVRVGANGRHMYNDLYYVSGDGYRYRQTFRGSDPNAVAFFANRSGFIDTDGSPLYRDMRGNGFSVNAGPSFTAGIKAAAPDFPIFFSDVSPNAPHATEVNRTLGALGIPLQPPVPELTNPEFVGNQSGNTTTVSAGGVFTFDTVNTMTYEIVVSRDGNDYDPATPTNRVLTGVANTGSHTVLWDGMDNSGDPFPAGDYDYRIIGRNGEIHFPMIDLEGNDDGGPTLIKLNGSVPNDSTVYYDDRGYQTAAGVDIGELNGHLCGAGHQTDQPSPTHSLLGVDSDLTDSDGKYYRQWSGSKDSNNDCQNDPDEYFGTAKALDLWALEKTAETIKPIEIIEQQPDTVDVGTAVTATPQVETGDTVYGSFKFGNYGSGDATGVTYEVVIGNPADPSTCPSSVNFTALPAGVGATYNGTPTCDVTFTGMPATLTPNQTLSFNFNYEAETGNDGPVPVTTEIAAGNENDDQAPNSAAAVTTILSPEVTVNKSADPADGTGVWVGDEIEYSVVVRISGASLSEVLTLNDTLSAGLNFGTVTNAAAFSCSGELSCTLPAGTQPGTYTLTYTAQVNPGAEALGSVSNQVTPSGGDPVCDNCSTQHPVNSPQIAVSKSADPADGESVTAGQTITYTLSAEVSSAPLTSPLVLTDTLGAGLSFGGITDDGDYSADTAGAPNLEFTLPTGTAPGNYGVSYTVTVDNDAGDFVANSVAPNGGSNTPPTCSTCETEHPVKHPTVAVTKSADPASGESVIAGQAITYTLSAEVSDAPLTEPLVLTDTLGTHLTFDEVTSAGDYTADTAAVPNLVFTLPEDSEPGSYEISYTVTVDNDANISVNNSVVPSGGGGEEPTCSTCETEHPVNTPVIAVDKSVDQTQAGPGDTAVYTILVENVGTVDVAQLTVSDPLPAGIASFDWECSATNGASCPNDSGTGALNEVGPLPQGGLLTYTVDAVVEDDASSIDLNVVTVTPDGFAECEDGSTAPCTADAEVKFTLPPVSIPTTNLWGLLLMMLGLLGLGGAAALRLAR